MSVPIKSLLLLALLTLADAAALWAGQCNVTTTPLNFGVYDTLDAAATLGGASLSVSCKNPVKIPATVTINLTSGSSGNYTQRTMTSLSGATLLYNLYADNNLSKVFGDGSGTSQNATQVVDKSTPWTLTLYGKIPALQPVPPGSYSDTLTATILW